MPIYSEVFKKKIKRKTFKEDEKHFTESRVLGYSLQDKKNCLLF